LDFVQPLDKPQEEVSVDAFKITGWIAESLLDFKWRIGFTEIFDHQFNPKKHAIRFLFQRFRNGIPQSWEAE
jgi:hypothetical protein